LFTCSAGTATAKWKISNKVRFLSHFHCATQIGLPYKKLSWCWQRARRV